MEIKSREKPVSSRLKMLIDEAFSIRGRFTQLEGLSKISSNRWQNFYYGKQEATEEMLRFWCKNFPNNADWLRNGGDEQAETGFPFANRIPRNWEGKTVGDRLNWVIAEWASPVGDELAKYLEKRSQKTIPAKAWKQVLTQSEQPSVEMIAVVTQERPHFTEWVLRGKVSGSIQVNPEDAASVKIWKEMNLREAGRKQLILQKQIKKLDEESKKIDRSTNDDKAS